MASVQGAGMDIRQTQPERVDTPAISSEEKVENSSFSQMLQSNMKQKQAPQENQRTAASASDLRKKAAMKQNLAGKPQTFALLEQETKSSSLLELVKQRPDSLQEEGIKSEEALATRKNPSFNPETMVNDQNMGLLTSMSIDGNAMELSSIQRDSFEATEGSIRRLKPQSRRSSSNERPVLEMEISLQDLRSSKVKTQKADVIHQKVAATVSGRGNSVIPNSVDQVETQGLQQDMEQGLVEELRSPQGVTYGAEGTGSKIEAPVTREVAASFQEHLARSGNADIVKNIRFVLKDNQAGEIKLVLKPESLGNVRIQLSMQENNIVGKIVVDNQSVKDAFMSNLNQLNQMLRDNGFENASLDVFVGQQDQQPQDPQELEEELEAMENARALRSLDEAVPQVATGYPSYEGSLNLVV